MLCCVYTTICGLGLGYSLIYVAAGRHRGARNFVVVRRRRATCDTNGRCTRQQEERKEKKERKEITIRSMICETVYRRGPGPWPTLRLRSFTALCAVVVAAQVGPNGRYLQPGHVAHCQVATKLVEFLTRFMTWPAARDHQVANWRPFRRFSPPPHFIIAVSCRVYAAHRMKNWNPFLRERVLRERLEPTTRLWPIFEIQHAQCAHECGGPHRQYPISSTHSTALHTANIPFLFVLFFIVLYICLAEDIDYWCHDWWCLLLLLLLLLLLRRQKATIASRTHSLVVVYC